MKLHRLILGTALAGLATMSAPSFAVFDLSNCDGNGLACPFVTYGDGQSYSLNLNAYIYNQAQGGGTGPGNPFYVNSTPGAIDSLVVNATGSSGNPVTTNFPGMDNAYPTPSGTGGEAFFTMNKTPYTLPMGNVLAPDDPGGAGQFTGDTANTWDTTVAALQSFLGAGNTPIFFFNNNQTNSGTTIDQDLAVWAQVSLSAPGLPTVFFDFTNTLCPYAAVIPGPAPCGTRFNLDPSGYTSSGLGPVAGDNSATDYVMAGGRLCIGPPQGGSPYPSLFDTLPDGTCPGGTTTINNNLGANQAAYAVVFPEMNALLAAYANGTMHVDLRFGCDPGTSGNTFTTDKNGNPVLVPGDQCNSTTANRSANNGYEQLFIAAANEVINVPEPATLALIGLGLLGVGIARRKTA